MMFKKFKKGFAYILVCVLTLSAHTAVYAQTVTSYRLMSLGSVASITPKQTLSNQDKAQVKDLENYLKNAANWITKNRNFKVYEDLADWDAFALSSSGFKVSEDYYKSIESTIKKNSGDFRKVTDVERMILAIAAIGKDPTNVSGYNLISKLMNHDKMVNQGVNGLIFALLAMDSKGYKEPANSLWSRQKLVNNILTYQNIDGGFSLVPKGENDVSLTAMAIQSLSNYTANDRVKSAINQAVNYLSKVQEDNGGYKTYGEPSPEDTAQVIIGLTSVGINPKDKRFVKQNGNLISNVKSFVNKDGSFYHSKKGEGSTIATHQSMMGIEAYIRYLKGEKKLYKIN